MHGRIGEAFRFPWVMILTAALLLGLLTCVEAKVAVSAWNLNYVEPLVEAFNAKNLGVEAEAVQLSPDALKTRLIANLAPDIAMYHVGYFDYEWEHYWLDLTQAVRQYGRGSDWLPGTWEAVTIPHGEYKGQIRRIKNTYEVPALYYDKDQMANTGLIEPADLHKAGSWTWEDMLGLAKTHPRHRRRRSGGCVGSGSRSELRLEKQRLL